MPPRDFHTLPFSRNAKTLRAAFSRWLFFRQAGCISAIQAQLYTILNAASIWQNHLYFHAKYDEPNADLLELAEQLGLDLDQARQESRQLMRHLELIQMKYRAIYSGMYPSKEKR